VKLQSRGLCDVKLSLPRQNKHNDKLFESLVKTYIVDTHLHITKQITFSYLNMAFTTNKLI